MIAMADNFVIIDATLSYLKGEPEDKFIKHKKLLSSDYKSSQCQGDVNEILQDFLQAREEELKEKGVEEFYFDKPYMYADYIRVLQSFIEESLYEFDIKFYEKELDFGLIVSFLLTNRRLYMYIPDEGPEKYEASRFVQMFLFILYEFIHIVYGEYKSV